VDEVNREAVRLSAPEEDEDGPNRTLRRELAQHFTLNVDEACHRAGEGSAKIVGMKSKKKHEKNQADSRVSITVAECGSAAGVDAPSMYLMQGDTFPARLQSTFGSSEWLAKNGAPANSFVEMTPSAFMTNSTWDSAAEKLARGIRMMPVIKDHPDFWCVLHLDGFKSHVMTYQAQVTFRKFKILVMKENSHSSQINQAFDQAPAKQAKAKTRRWLGYLRDTPGLSKVVDQWQLLCAVLTGQNGGRCDAWTSGFKRVNLHPDYMVPIDVWLSQISAALVAAGGTETSNEHAYGLKYLQLVRVPDFLGIC
jgi:sulfur relay (sulfurtransferase) DsrC/TusE family protein